MVKLKRSQIRTIEEAVAYPHGFGYVLDFSDSTFAEFFEDEFGVDIYDDKYSGNGTSKGNRLTAFIEAENNPIVAKVLRTLWDQREGLKRRNMSHPVAVHDTGKMKEFLDVIKEVEGRNDTLRTDGLERYEHDQTLDELIQDIERDIDANKPEAAMDHLHTYCMKKFAHLLSKRRIPCDENEALPARLGKYRKALEQERQLTEFTNRAMKSAISLFESFNEIRNNRSFAHDNPILDSDEARYVFQTISAILVFLRAVEAGRYEA